MSLATIGNERWDFVDATGDEIRLPEAEAPPVTFPSRWRVFGPLSATLQTAPEWLAAKATAAALKHHTTMPDTLAIGGETLEARDVALDGYVLNLGNLIGGYETVFLQDWVGRAGQQAYAFAQLVLDEERKITFGAGADYFMQWWIDGEPVCDTIEHGNQTHPPGRTDHIFKHRLAAGRHLLAIWLIGGQSSWVLEAGVLTERDKILASLTFSDRWQFLPDLDEIRPARRPGATGGTALDWDHTMAIAADRCLTEETITCEYQQTDAGNFGVILGAQDSGHYYTAQVPYWGQLWRARGFWACICRADGGGHLRILKMQLMPNVVCHTNAWHKLEVERRGNRIQMRVDGVTGPCVEDDTYGPGRAGITGFTKYVVRKLRIDGTAGAGPAWQGGDHRGKPWSVPVPDMSYGDVQDLQGGKLLELSDEEVLLALPICEAGRDPVRADLPLHLFLSRDGGQSWSPHGVAADGLRGARWFVTGPGRIRAVSIGQTAFDWTYRDSVDRGLTWSDPTAGKLLGDWHRDILREGASNGCFGFTVLNDGTLLAVILHGNLDQKKDFPGCGQGTWGAGFVAQPYCTLSTDQGLSWSEPVPMDNAAQRDGDPPDSPCGGFSETSVAQLPGGRIVALARPYQSPFMWQTHSDDGGRTWRMACYAPFSGSGDPQMVATRSGYLVSVKRGPCVSLHISTDGGVNWDQGTIIDYPASFNGSMIEVEPDVVLVIYPESMGEIRPSFARAQRIRITPRMVKILGRHANGQHS
jgi:hypothetical protein